MLASVKQTNALIQTTTDRRRCFKPTPFLGIDTGIHTTSSDYCPHKAVASFLCACGGCRRSNFFQSMATHRGDDARAQSNNTAGTHLALAVCSSSTTAHTGGAGPFAPLKRYGGRGKQASQASQASPTPVSNRLPQMYSCLRNTVQVVPTARERNSQQKKQHTERVESPGRVGNSCYCSAPRFSNLGVRIIHKADRGPGDNTFRDRSVSIVVENPHGKSERLRDHIKQTLVTFLNVLPYFARVVSVAISTAGLLLATHREIHPRVATRACIAFLESKAATTSSTTCGTICSVRYVCNSEKVKGIFWRQYDHALSKISHANTQEHKLILDFES